MGAIVGIVLGLNCKWSVIVFVLRIYLFSKIIEKYLIKKYIRYFKIIFNKKTLFIFAISAIIFNSYTLFLNNKYKEFYKKVEDTPTINAMIISSKKEGNYYNSYVVKGKSGIYKNKKFILYTNKFYSFAYGEIIGIKGEFFEPDETRNYKGYNYKNYLKTEGIYGTIKAENIKNYNKNKAKLIFKLSNLVREKIIEITTKILPDETNGLLIGLMLGDKTYMQKEVVTSFQKSNLAHILAVSGTHVSYFILGLTFVNRINKLSKKSGYFLIIFALIAFIFITDFSLSVIRAGIMAIIAIVAKLAYRKLDVKNAIAIILLITLIHNPYNIQNLSLQLSYLGTIGVLFISQNFKIKKIKKIYIEKILSAIKITVSAQLAILPIMIIEFHTISLTFVISNLLALPVLGVTMILGYIVIITAFISLRFSKILGIILNIFLKILIQISGFISKMALSNIYVTRPRTITIIIYYIILCFFTYTSILKKETNLRPYLKRKLQKINYKKLLICVFIIIIIIEIPYENLSRKLKIYFVDVGQRRQHFHCYT